MAFTFTDESNIHRRLPVVAGGGAAVSARKLAASLWQMAATTNCGEDVRWKCGLSDGLGFEVLLILLFFYIFQFLVNQLEEGTVV